MLIELQPSRRPDKTSARFGFGSGQFHGCPFEFGVARGLEFSSDGALTGCLQS